MPLIKLDINYDPELPPWMQGPPGFDPNMPPEPRWFKFNKGGVKVGPVFFAHRHRNTGGFDPYSGDDWKTKIAGFNISLTNVICYEVKVHRGAKLVYRECESERKGMSWLFLLIWDFLEDRLEYDKYQCAQDYYGSKEYYE